MSRVTRSAQLTHDSSSGTVLNAGFCGALDPRLERGDVVLASEVRDPTGTTLCDDQSILAGVLQRAGLRVHVGPIASSQRLVLGERRRALHRSGAVAVDRLAPVNRVRPLVTLRVVLETRRRQLRRPHRTMADAAVAHRNLRQACTLVQEWARAIAPRQVLLASPRASCAGVARAIRIVEHALEERGAPIYVRKQIVHNSHVVRRLHERGAIFVDSLHEVPKGATVIFSAHGVSPAVRAEAAERSLDVIDATCPLVSKVHAEARRFAADGFDIVLVGHEGHEEVEGTVGQAPEHTHVIATAAEVSELQVRDAAAVAYLTQTTLATDDTTAVVQTLRDRFPAAVGPPSSDICYATQNRQDGIRMLAGKCDLIVVVGSANSSNSRRLVEVAEHAGCRALLVDHASAIPPEALVGAQRIGVSAGASAPEALVQGVVAALDGLGGVTVKEHSVATEKVHFKLPPEVRPKKCEDHERLPGTDR